MQCRLVVDGDGMTIQYRGAPQTDAFINGAWPAVAGQTWSTLVSQLCYEIPINAGLWRPIEFDLGPRGTIVNSVPPAPVTQSHMETGMRINKMLIDALSQACSFSEDPVLASRVAGQPCQNLAFFTSYGVDARTGSPTIAFPVSLGQPCGGGAQTVGDGLDTYAAQCMCGCNNPDVEMEETFQPGIILWRRVARDTAGAGIRRGGMGVAGAMAIIHSEFMTGGAYNNCAIVPPRGAAGGYPGAAGNWELLTNTNVAELLERGEWPTEDRVRGEKVAMPAKTGQLALRHGDVFSVVNGGGGGVGDPLLRDPRAVAKDVRDGYVSPEVADVHYGVVLDDSGHADRAGTDERRTGLRAQRLGSEPPRAPDPDGPVYAPLRVAENRWECSLCGQDLGNSGTNWRLSAVTAETKLVERYRELRSQVRELTSGSPVVMRENFCPGCATSLAVDVTLAGHDAVPASRIGSKDPYPAHP